MNTAMWYTLLKGGVIWCDCPAVGIFQMYSLATILQVVFSPLKNGPLNAKAVLEPV